MESEEEWFNRMAGKGIFPKYHNYQDYKNRLVEVPDTGTKLDTEIKPDPKLKEEYRLFKKVMPKEEKEKYNFIFDETDEEIEENL
jgi:hypothetical protein